MCRNEPAAVVCNYALEYLEGGARNGFDLGSHIPLATDPGAHRGIFIP